MVRDYGLPIQNTVLLLLETGTPGQELSLIHIYMVTDKGTVYLNFKVLTCGKPAAVKITNLIVGNNQSEGAYPADVTSTVTINHPADKQIVDETTNPATCTTSGTKVVTCGVCGTEISRTEIPPLGHDEGTWVVTKEATCGAEGSKELRCTRCQTVLDTQKISATGKHTVEKWTENKPADCKNDGEKSGVCTCLLYTSRCV